MSKINFPKKQEQRLIPKYLLEYSEELVKHHPDPSEDWGGVDNIVAGTGIEITGNKTKTISVDEESVAMVANLDPVAFSGNYNDLSNKPSIPTKTSDLTNDSGFITNSALTGYATETYVDNAVDGLDQTLATVAKTGSYSDLSNKPDLTIYELKSEAFTGDYNDLTNKPDLSVYELKSEAFSGNYNDLTNKPTIPTKTSDLINNSGFITNSALANYERKLTIINLPFTTSSGTLDATTLASLNANPEAYAFKYYSVLLVLANIFDNSYYYRGLENDSNNNIVFSYRLQLNKTTGDWTVTAEYINRLVTGTNDGFNWTSLTIGTVTKSIPSGSSSYTAGTGIDITNDVISIDNTVALKTDIPTVPTNVSAFTNDAGYITGITSSDVTTALGYTPGTSNFSGDYDDLTNKPTIPTVNDPTITFTQGGITKGTITLNQASNQTIALDAGSAPTNMVTTDTTQTITGAKTFTTNPIDVVNTQKGIKLHSGINNSTNSKLGFTLFNSTAGSTVNEVGFLESNTASVRNNGHSTLLGYYNTSRNTDYSDWELGFAYNGYNTTKGSQIAYKLMIPNQYNLNAYSTKRYIPIDFTNGTNTVRSDATGIVDISTLLPTIPTNYVTTDTTQTITGEKTFDADVSVINGNNIYATRSIGYFDQLYINGGLDKLEDVFAKLNDVPTPTVLYDVPNGEDGVNPITMSDSFANYDYVDIQYRNYDNANQVKSVRIYNPNGKEVYVDWSVLNNGYIYAKKSIYVLNGNTMTVKTGSDMQAYYSNGSNMGVQVTATAQYQLQIKITKVVGWTDSRLS